MIKRARTALAGAEKDERCAYDMVSGAEATNERLRSATYNLGYAEIHAEIQILGEIARHPEANRLAPAACSWRASLPLRRDEQTCSLAGMPTFSRGHLHGRRGPTQKTWWKVSCSTDGATGS